MSGEKDPLDRFNDEFELIIESSGAEDDEPPFRAELKFAEMRDARCSRNYGEPCSNSGNNPCDERGVDVTHCRPSGVSYCRKVNNEGCHGGYAVLSKR